METSEIKPLSFQSFTLLLVPVTTSYHRDPSPVKTNKGSGGAKTNNSLCAVVRGPERRDRIGLWRTAEKGGLDEISAVVLHRRQELLEWKW